ncbi:hypothetical protein VXP99_08960 [Acinetobacter towneri]
MKWLKKLMGCQCWACKNVRLGGGGYQPCHKKVVGEPKAPPRKP